jgi:hypothetical protein
MLRAEELCLNELWRSLETDCLARYDTMPFYRCKGMVYNTWLTGASTIYLQANFLLKASRVACAGRLTCP